VDYTRIILNSRNSNLISMGVLIHQGPSLKTFPTSSKLYPENNTKIASQVQSNMTMPTTSIIINPKVRVR